MLLGGHGNVSVTANVAPRAMAELCRAAIAGNARQASEIHLKLLALHRQLFAEANPIPVKWALARLGRCGPALRLPLVGLSEALHAPLEQALREAGLLCPGPSAKRSLPPESLSFPNVGRRKAPHHRCIL